MTDPSPVGRRRLGWRIRLIREIRKMFETILAEIKLMRAALTAKKYFTATSHGGKALTAAGDLGAKFFESGPITLMGDDAASMATLEAIVAECECLEREATLVSATAGDIDTTGLDPATIALIVQLIQMFGPVVMDLVKRIIERRKNRS